MKIAVAYKDGEVFAHFGKSEEFKVYEIENGEVINSNIVTAVGEGHDAVAASLETLGVNAVICGGLGDGAKEALDNAGIVVFSGAEGSADDAVSSFLKGELTSEGSNCNCSEEGCGSCGGGCGGCSGCGGGAPMFEGPNVGKICKVHYRGTFDNGEVFDSSYDRGEPIQFVCGMGMMIKGFDKAVATMNVGDKVSIHLTPDEAYGEANPNYIIESKIAELPGSENLEVGAQVVLANEYGQQFPVRVTAKTEDTITLDANHEMAGKELNFDIELVEATGDVE